MSVNPLTLFFVLALSFLAALGLIVAVERFSGPLSHPARLGVALATAGVAVWATMVAPDRPTLAASLLLGWSLLLLAIVDVRILRLPDIVTLPLVGAGLLAAVVVSVQPLTEHVVGALVGYTAFALIGWAYRAARARDGLGLGDAKLLAVAGAWLTWRGLPSVVLLGAIGALLWVIVLRMRRQAWSASEPLPFGAPLCLAIWVTWLHGPLGQFS